MFKSRKNKCNFITQSSSEHSITVAINESDVKKAEKALNYAFEDDLVSIK
jgi:aspartokinase/homoserine dehydrogenase 1